MIDISMSDHKTKDASVASGKMQPKEKARRLAGPFSLPHTKPEHTSYPGNIFFKILQLCRGDGSRDYPLSFGFLPGQHR